MPIGISIVPQILSEFIAPEGASIDDFRNLYEKSETNQEAIKELCSSPYNLDKCYFVEGAPVYYFAREPNCAPFGKTLGKHNLVTTISSLRDPIYDTIEAEDDLYREKCGSKLVSRKKPFLRSSDLHSLPSLFH